VSPRSVFISSAVHQDVLNCRHLVEWVREKRGRVSEENTAVRMQTTVKLRKITGLLLNGGAELGAGMFIPVPTK